MRYRHLTLAILVLLCGAIAASGRAPTVIAQTAQPTGAGFCAPSTPCVDPPAQGVEGALSFSGAGVNAAAAAIEAVESQPQSSGFGLAWAVEALLVAVLLYTLVAAVFVALGRALPVLPAAVNGLIPILALIGLGVAFYLTFVETRNVKAVCGPVGDCNAVQASPFARLFGFLPVGLLGAMGYIAILAAWGLGRRGHGGLARLAPVVLLGMALFGVLFSIYLTYIELFVIYAVCIWCLTSAVIMALILTLSVGPVMDALTEA